MVVVLVAVVAFVVYNLLPKDSVSNEKVGEAVLQLRQDMAQAADFPQHPWAEIPPYGVYRYATEGSESLNSFIFSSGHKYGKVTTISLIPIRCGVMERWQPLVERGTESDLCLKPKTSRIVAVRDFHEFFGQAKQTDYTCAGDSVPYPPELRPGMSWQTKCTSDSGTVVSNVEVVGIEKVPVAGEPIEAVHLRAKAVLNGDPDGADIRDSWIRRTDGLLLRRTDDTKARLAAAGGSDYSENYTLNLISTQPQR